jgi:hypothetical protein
VRGGAIPNFASKAALHVINSAPHARGAHSIYCGSPTLWLRHCLHEGVAFSHLIHRHNRISSGQRGLPPIRIGILFRVSLLCDFTRIYPVADVGLTPSDSTLAKFYRTWKIALANQPVNVPRLVADDAGKFLHAEQSVHDMHEITRDHTRACRFGSG